MTWSSHRFGREVLGPITGEFCLRLWAMGSMLEQPDNTAMLFCARGGLRLMLAYERFLSVANLKSPTRIAGLMISRVVAIKPALLRTTAAGTLSPSVSATLTYEFSNHSLRDVVRAMSGWDPGPLPSMTNKFTPEGFASFLLAPEGAEACETIEQQATLFQDHLARALDGRRHALLVDTGLFGTTLQLLAEGIPELDFSSALIARSSYGRRRLDRQQAKKIIGLSVEMDGYSPFQPRSAILRYWHMIESTFEPDLPSVRSFTEQDSIPVANLEIPGWRDRLEPAPDSMFAGIIDYLTDLPRGNASAVLVDTGRAWRQLRRAVVWPDALHATMLDAGARGNDFGTEATSASARPWNGPFRALRDPALWREGDIARSGTTLRLPLLVAIETAYGARRMIKILSRLRGK